jgi:3-phenylpropionate/trans-cinnamate dioxygenase ferredoxin subunit
MTAETATGTAASGPVRYVVARAADIAEGERLIVEIGGREVGIFNHRGVFRALLHRCPHAGGPLCSGDLQPHIYGERPADIRMDPDRVFVACPWHGWLFDIETGQSWWDPVRTRARRVPVEVAAGGEIAERLGEAEGGQVPGPYVAEVFPVEVEDDYVVVTVRPRRERRPTDAAP